MNMTALRKSQMSIPKKQLAKSRKQSSVEQPARSTRRLPIDSALDRKTQTPKAERSKKPEQSYQLFDYAVADSDLQQMVGKTILDQFLVYAARFQLVVDLTDNPNDESGLADSDLEQIKQLAAESKRSDYRKIMKAIVTAVRQGPRGIYLAHRTAIRAVHLFFNFTPEYIASLERYEAKLRASGAWKKQ